MFCFKEIGDVIGFPFSPTLDIFTLCSERGILYVARVTIAVVTENINVRVFSPLRGFLKLEAVEFT